MKFTLLLLLKKLLEGQIKKFKIKFDYCDHLVNIISLTLQSDHIKQSTVLENVFGSNPP